MTSTTTPAPATTRARGRPLRVLLCLHHHLEPDAGAPGTTLALGNALRAENCEVEYLTFDDAYGTEKRPTVACQLAFPWHVAAFLARHASRFDVIDASTGAAWVWASLGRPGARRDHALVTRSHGLEHTLNAATRRAAHEQGPRLRRRYALYHGGYRLWEVRRSLERSDHCILLNRRDRDYVAARLGIASGRLSVITNAVPDHFHDAPVAIRDDGGPLRIAFIGRWTTLKGKTNVVQVAKRLHAEGVDFELLVLGTGAADIKRDFPPAVAARVSVTSRFRNRELPGLIAGHEILLFPTHCEGSSGSLLEAMACGLAPVTTAVGSAPEVIRPGENGILVDIDDAEAMVAAIVRLAGDGAGLLRMRTAAEATSRGFRWSTVARRTLELYEDVLESRARTAARTAPARPRSA